MVIAQAASRKIRSGRSVHSVWLYAAVLMGFTAMPASAQASDAQFLNAWAAETRTRIPSPMGAFELTEAISRCRAGCEQTDNVDYLLLGVKATRVTKENATIGQMEQSLKPDLLEGYCRSPGRQKGITLGVFVKDMRNASIGNFWVYPADCAASATPKEAAPANVRFLNDWAAETRSKMPMTVGYIELTGATSFCPAGCEQDFADTYLAVTASMPRHGKDSVSLEQLVKYLKSQLLGDYCRSDGRKKNLTLRFHVYDMRKVLTGDVGFSPRDCP